MDKVIISDDFAFIAVSYYTFRVFEESVIIIYVFSNQKRKRRLSEPGSASVDGEGIDNDGGPAEEEDLQEGILPAPILPKAPLEEAMKPLTVNTEFTTPTPQSSTEARK